MVEFAGWDMPIQYAGVIQEHLAVRSGVGVFDVSHMGRIEVEGLGAEALMDYLSTNAIIGKQEGSATYTVWCYEAGGCVDDLLVYKWNQTKFFVVVNAGNRQKDLDHLLANSRGRDVTITDHYQDEGILAVQGPKAMDLITELFPEAAKLKPMHFIETSYNGQAIIISATGYTGAGGVEIYAPNTLIKILWDLLFEAGAKYGIVPVGLGARDTLRLEKGYALYGHELSDTISANESVSAWTIKSCGRDFLGKTYLETSPKRHQYGVILQDRGIAREGYMVYQGGQEIGIVTSGTQSPSLNQAIAIVLVDKNLKDGDSVEIQIRQNRCAAKVVKLPFLP